MERTPWAFVFALLLCATGRLFAQEGAELPERFRESITLETSRQGSRQFANISEHSRAGRWDAAADELARVIATDGDALVAVARGRYLNVRRHANLLVATFPPEGRTAFRRQMDPLVRGLFEEGREKGNVTALQRVVRDGFASSFGDDALLILGENAFEQNEIARARMLWMKMLPAPIALSPGDSLPVPRYPDSDTDRAAILARLILCSLLEGDRDRAALELSAFAKQYPDATGTLAGRTGVLAEIVQKLLQESVGWSSPSPGERMQTFAVNSHRSGVLPDAVEVAAPIWSRTIADDPYRPRSAKSFLEQRPLSTYPVTFDEIVLISDSQQVFAYKIRTGEPAWGGGENDSAAIYPVAPEPPRPLPDAPLIGVPQYTMTVAEGRLYARMGSPVTGRSAQELRPQENHLVCLDLAEGEGKLVWRTDAGEKLSGWAFEGSPVVSNGRLFVALRQGFPETQTNVACL
ncbi:MAG: tol-pal system YbgF family protein, partial [Planctomycetaceae bacterium]